MQRVRLQVLGGDEENGDCGNVEVGDDLAGGNKRIRAFFLCTPYLVRYPLRLSLCVLDMEDFRPCIWPIYRQLHSRKSPGNATLALLLSLLRQSPSPSNMSPSAVLPYALLRALLKFPSSDSLSNGRRVLRPKLRINQAFTSGNTAEG
jgi:hypothetical protein